MTDGLTFRECVKIELEKIRSMNTQKRWEYFKTYYLVKTLIGLVVLVSLLHLIYSIRLGGREVLASGCFVNVEISEEGAAFLTDDYVSFCGRTDKDSVANISLGNTFNFFSENPLDNNSYEMALLTQISAGEYQYMILDKAGLERFAKLDIYADLEEIMDASQRELLVDRIVYQPNQDGQNQAASAIGFAGTEFAKKYLLVPEDAYLVFIDVEQDVEKNHALLDYFLGVF